MVLYFYVELQDKTKIPVDCTEFHCNNNNLTELPELPKSLEILWCQNNNLTELPVLPHSLIRLWCENNNIKYLSLNNCKVIKKCNDIKVLNNPFSTEFTSDKDFKEYLMNL